MQYNECQSVIKILWTQHKQTYIVTTNKQTNKKGFKSHINHCYT